MQQLRAFVVLLMALASNNQINSECKKDFFREVLFLRAFLYTRKEPLVREALLVIQYTYDLRT